MLEEVRREAKQYPNPPEDYDDFVTYLQMVENGMKERRDAINRYQRSKAKTSSKWTQQTSQISNNNKASNQRGSVLKPHQSKRPRHHNGKECTYCGKLGHWESEYYTKQQDQQAAEKTSKGSNPKN